MCVHTYMKNASAGWNDACFFSCWRIAGSDAAGAEGVGRGVVLYVEYCTYVCDVGVGCAGEGKGDMAQSVV